MAEVCVSAAIGNRWIIGGLLVTGGLYTLSFLLPAVQPLRNGHVYPGWEAFRMVMGRPFQELPLDLGDVPYILPLWLSNPLLWAGLFLWTRRWFRVSAIAGILALIGGSLLAGKKGEIIFGPAGAFQADSGIGAGYFVWLSSMLMLVVFSILGAIMAKGRNRASLVPPPESKGTGGDQILAG